MNKAAITLEDIRSGSDAILGRVYEESRNPFIHFAARYGLPREDVVDVYQDAFMAFYDNVMSGKVQEFTSSITTYIISIGKYKMLDKIRSKKRTVHPEFDVSVLLEKNELLDNLDLDEPEQTVEQQQFYAHFETLGKKCKEILDLFYYRGFTISDILDLGEYTSENVIKSTKSRCIKTLRERIDPKI
jgi:RNA polymerase sigma-70 factor (ECF subfamily)